MYIYIINFECIDKETHLQFGFTSGSCYTKKETAEFYAKQYMENRSDVTGFKVEKLFLFS